jgi:rubrerythrin
MKPIRTFGTASHADSAAAYLRAHGVLARIAGRLGASGVMGAVGHGAYDVYITNPSQEARALQLLESFKEETALITPDDLADQSRPDLSRLNPAFLPPCPACGAVLPPDASLAACPQCRGPVDLEALILERSGPEALASCYEDAAEDIPDEAIQQAIVVCPVCQYSLSELAPRGVCPECGTRYDKAELLTRRAGPL